MTPRSFSVILIFLLLGILGNATSIKHRSLRHPSMLAALNAHKSGPATTVREVKKTETNVTVTITTQEKCFYTLYLANFLRSGYGGARVVLTTDQGYPEGFSSAGISLEFGLKHSGWNVPVSANQTLYIRYLGNSSFHDASNEFWVSNAAGAAIIYAKNPSSVNLYTVGKVSCDCEYLSECPATRMRKEWRSLPYCDRINFLNALHKFRSLGDDVDQPYNDMVINHAAISHVLVEHGLLLTWHRVFILDFENRLRSLGGTFTCVSLPYWDWTLDFGSETRSDIYNDFGGLKNNSCLDGEFAAWQDPVLGGCVKRRTPGLTGRNLNVAFPPLTGVQFGVTANNSYSFILQYLARDAHVAPHNLVGGSMAVSSSPSDPLFWLHHAALDRSWALWQDCWDYDKLKNSEAEQQYMDRRGGAALDSTLPLYDVKIRDTMNIAQLGYRYTPVYEDWMTLMGDSAKCKWDWFSPRDQEEDEAKFKGSLNMPVQTSFRHHVHSDSMRKRLSLIKRAFWSELRVTASYMDALTTSMRKECIYGQAFTKDDSPRIIWATFGTISLCNGKEFLCRNVCKLLEENKLSLLLHS